MSAYVGFNGLTDGDRRSYAEREFDARVESRIQEIYGDASVRAKYALRYLSTSDRVFGELQSVVGTAAWLTQSPEDLFDLWLHNTVTDELRLEARDAA